VIRLGRYLAILALVIGGAFMLPQGAAGHALLQSSVPARGSTVGTAPSTIELVFGEKADPRLSSVKVLDASGVDHASGGPSPAAANPLELDVAVGPLADGVYTVAWRTVSSVDGHAAAGSFAFGVGVTVTTTPGSETTAGTSSSASLPADAMRWLLYLGLVSLLGATFLGLAIDPAPRRSVIRMAGLGWLVASAGTLGVIGFQWGDAGGDLSAVLGSSIGTSAIERLAFVVIGGVAVGLLLLPRRQAGRRIFGLAAAAAAGAMLVDVLNGHGAAGELPVLKVAVQWLHVVATGFWIGGLAALLLDLRGQPGEDKLRAARQYSTWAGIALAAVVVTGTTLAILEIGSIDALVGTDYGRVVLLKSGLLGGLAILGASNRYLNIPTLVARLWRFRRFAFAEVAIGAGILALSGLLVNLAPPVSSSTTAKAPQAAPPIIASGHDFGTSVKVRLVISPGAAGFNRFDAAVTDFDTGAPAPATAVSLRFSITSRTGVGGSNLALQPGAPGAFTASSGNLSLDGIWKVTATVTSPAGAVEVPLVVSTTVPPQPIDVNATPGVPTIYTIHLADGRSLQIYLDPEVAGAGELHATFFDAAGTELPVPTAAMAIAGSDGAGTLLQPRQLEPGHFVAEVTVTAGPLAVDVVGSDPAAGLIHVHATIEVQP